MNETELTNTVVIIKKCPNHIRGCRNILAEDYSRKKCEDCLRKEREADKRRRDEAKAKQQETSTGGEANTSRVCTTCCKEYPIEHFQGLRPNTTTKTCQTCRENNKKQDTKRDKEHRNELARECSKKPEQIARKKEWVENNYDKVAETWQRHRQKQIEQDSEQYLRKNAEQAKKWREANPEKYAQFLEDSKSNLVRHFTTYKRCSIIRGISFELTEEQFTKMVKSPCYYCGEFTSGCSINGIDRKYSDKAYSPENTVPCCNMCNMMKNTLNEYTFLKQIEHILTFQKLVQGQFCSEVFCDYEGIATLTNTFKAYKSRAIKKQVEFELTLEYFKQIIQDDDCYICNKSNSSSHRNGIDRFVNDIGYTIENCRVCCFNCNLMKKNYSFDEIIQKLLLIYGLHKNDTFENTVINRGMEKSNKMSKAELEQYQFQHREQRITQLKDRYTPEQIKQNAQNIAEKRTNNNTQTNPVA